MKKGFVRQLEFREAFLWEKEMEDFVKENAKGLVLNVPCGKPLIVYLNIDSVEVDD